MFRKIDVQKDRCIERQMGKQKDRWINLMPQPSNSAAYLAALYIWREYTIIDRYRDRYTVNQIYIDGQLTRQI